MSDTRRLIEQVGERFPFPEDAFERMLRRGDRKRRNERIGAIVLVAAIAGAGFLAAVSQSRSAPIPADETPAPATVRNGEVVLVTGPFWVPDANPALRAMDPHTGRTRRLVVCDQECYMSGTAWSPDGTEFVYSSGGSLLVLDVETGATRTLAPVKSEGPIFSPDGERIAYQVGEKFPSDFFVVGRDGSGRTRLNALSDRSLRWYQWSPDGRSIAYWEQSDLLAGGGSIGLVGVDGQATDRALVSFPESDACHEQDNPTPCQHAVAMSPADGRIAYATYAPETASETVLMIDPEGGEPAPIATWTDSRIEWMTWSADGSRIAVAAGCQVWTMASDGTDRRLIKDLAPCLRIDRLAWSPDGAKLAFVQTDPGEEALVVDVTLMVLTVDEGSVTALATLTDDTSVSPQPLAWQAVPTNR
jgi:Tol biopolymer transport system component